MLLTDTQPCFRELRVVGAMDDAIDGTARLLLDLQRFGFRLSSLSLEAPPGKEAHIVVTIAVPAESDSEQVLGRLARHTAVRSLRVDNDVTTVRG